MDARALTRPPTEREMIAQRIFDRLHPLMTWLAVLFLLVVLGDTLVAGDSPFDEVFTALGWTIWIVFLLEYLVRLVIAPSTREFLKRNWWQVIFLIVPFLALSRAVLALRVARAGRLVSAAVRGTRTARQNLSSRMGWLAAVTIIVILVATDALYEFANMRPYGKTLHDVALATIAGVPMAHPSGVVQLVNVGLVTYSVVVFATLAGALGAFFLERRQEAETSVHHDGGTSSGPVAGRRR